MSSTPDKAADDLNKIIPTPVFVEVAGEKVQIRTIKVKYLSLVLKEIQPFASVFKQSQENVDLIQVAMDHIDNVIVLVATLVEKPQEWVEELEIDELVSVFTKLVEVNIDFFIRKVIPSLSEGMGKLNSDLKRQTP